MKLKIRLTLFCFLLIFFTTSVTFASYDTVHVKKGTIRGGATQLLIWFDSSMNTSGYDDPAISALSGWSQASSKIKFTFTNESNAEVKVYASSLPSGTYGVADYWDKGWFGILSQVSATDVTNGTNFDVGRVRLGKNTTSGWLFNEKVMNAGHEIGHVLGLNHFETSPAHTGNHWMKSGKFSMLKPSTQDVSHVKHKVGD